MKYKVIVPVLALATAGILVFGMPAQANAQSPGEEIQSLVQMIASKFGLKTADVQSVVDQHRQQMQAKHETNYEARLTQLVKDGKITEAQKQLILTKHKELETKREENRNKMKDMTPEQRKAAMQAEKTEIETWAKQNNIDVKYLFGGDMGRWGMRMKGKVQN